MTNEPLHRLHEVYIDETSQSGPRWLVIGGLVFPAHYSSAFEQAILDARRPTFPDYHTRGKKIDQPYEIGWNEFTSNSRSEFAAYKRIADTFFTFRKYMTKPIEEAMHFHCAIVDTHHRGRQYSGQAGQVGFSREIYFHCLRLLRNDKLYKGCYFHGYPDERTTKEDPEKMMEYLEGGIKKENPIDSRWFPFRRFQFRKSHEWQALQVSDILIGAIAYRLNAYDDPKSHPKKKELCKYILQKGRAWLDLDPQNPQPTPWGVFRTWVRKHRS